MKTVFLLISVLVLFNSCNLTNKSIIEGRLSNSKEEFVVLNLLENNKLKPFDSVLTDKQGRFFLAVKLAYTDFVFLKFPRTGSIVRLIIKPGEKLTFMADASRIGQTYQVDGSPESEKARELILHFLTNRDKLDSITSHFSKTKHTDTLAHQKYKMEKELLLQNFANERVRFILENKTSMASLMALEGLQPTSFFSYFSMVDSALMKNYPKSQQVIALHNYVEKLRLQKTANESANRSTATGKLAPDFRINDPDGKEIALSSFRGKYVLLDFWASWCKPCRKENLNLAANYKNYKIKGFEIFQVSLDKKKEDWIYAIGRDRLWWKHGCDFQFWNSQAAKTYHIEAIPANFLLDKEGRIIAKNLHGADLTKKLGEILDTVKVAFRRPAIIDFSDEVKFRVGEDN